MANGTNDDPIDPNVEPLWPGWRAAHPAIHTRKRYHETVVVDGTERHVYLCDGCKVQTLERECPDCKGATRGLYQDPGGGFG